MSPSNPRFNGCPLGRDLTPRNLPLDSLKPLGRETRKHPAQQIRKMARSLERFGFVLPVVVDEKARVVSGSGLVLAARLLELREIPAVTVTDLSEAELRALRIALNRLGEESDWDRDALRIEMTEILQLDGAFELEFTGFEIGEIDVLLGDHAEEEDEIPALDEISDPVTRPGDLWILGQHRVFCGDALNEESYALLLGSTPAGLVFTDPPYNVPIEGHVSGLGAVTHREFAMASGEMTPEEFIDFLSRSLGLAARHSTDGAIHFVCMDWRHVRELLKAGERVYSELKNICVWNKSNAGMGSLYRSKHELVFVFKSGTGPHLNNVALGRYGRHRSNVWDYAGQNTLSAGAKGKLALHPTVKPVAMVADAIRDCSDRGALVLDPFGGSGTTLIAAEKAGRRAALIEYEPRYVDVIVRRWQALTGQKAVNGDTFDDFEEITRTHPEMEPHR